MKLKTLLVSLLLTTFPGLLLVTPARSEDLITDVLQNTKPVDTDATFQQPSSLLSSTQPVTPLKIIPRLSEVERPITNAQMLAQSPTSGSQVIQITGVKANPTSKGLEVILQTSKGQQLQPTNRSSGNSFIADIPNAQLRLPSGDTFIFRSTKPIAGIIEITVINQDANTVRVTVTGETMPTVELFDSPNEGLIFSVATAASRAQQPQPPQTPQKPQALKPGNETPSKPSASGDDPIELVVRGEQDGYRVPNATTATRTDTPILDIPQSIQVVPQQVLKDQQVTRVEEALSNVSGVTYNGTTNGRGDTFNLRGFNNAPVLQDGFRIYSIEQPIQEVADLERVEVLKGPASILYGDTQPGGIINLVTKKPLRDPFYEVEQQFGNRNFVRSSVDISGPLNSNGSLLYRLNGLYTQGDSFRNYDNQNQRYLIAPTFTWKISDRTDLNVSLRYFEDQRPVAFGLPAQGNRVVDVPRDRIVNEPNDSSYTNKYLSTGYDLEHRFSENWKLHSAFRYLNYNSDVGVVVAPFTFNEATGNLTRYFTFTQTDNKSYSLQNNVTGKFATGSVKHTLLFGADLNRTELNSYLFADLSTPLPLNIFNPVYRQIPPRPPGERVSPFRDFGDTQTNVDRLGIYLQDQISLFDNLILLAGVRYDTIDQKTLNQINGSEQNQNPDAVTPRVGLVYKIIPNLSLYASYSQSFNPNTGTTVSGNALPPEKGEGYEAGVKAELLGGRLLSTLAYFDITRQNVATADPNNLIGGFQIAAGEQKSRGVELDLSGQILPGWNIIAAYTYTDATVTKDTNALFVGSTLPNIPKHSASLWTTYELQHGSLQGLGFGAGFNFVGSRFGGLPNSFEVDSYFVTNAALFYRRDNWRFALNFKNLFDVNYIEGVGTSRVGSAYFGEPFTVIGSVSVRF